MTKATSKVLSRAKARSKTAFPVVGIGASAGGLEACSELLKHLPGHPGVAVVLVQHLDPNHPSHLSEILQRTSKMPVAEVTDGMKVEVDHVYIIPPNVKIRIADMALKLTPRETVAGCHLPIDEFFRSLAESCDGTAIGVVLSGTATDGTVGLKAIKAAGGITFAQDEGTAKYPGMPNSAIASGCVDFVLPPGQIAEEILRLGAHLLVAMPVAETGKPQGDGLKRIFSLLRGVTGVDFSHYKQTTINRRIQRRLIIHQLVTFDEYAAFLETHPEEIEAAYQDALIHVTSFFREPETFAALEKQVFPVLLKNRMEGEPIRVWLPGCSTGEEAYSVAISLTEFMGDSPDAPVIQVFGTDVSERVVAQARKGLFEEGIEEHVSAERLRRFFTRVERGWQIGKEIRDRCVFARQNVIKDPPFSKIDLVICRNVLIY
ncbi:MAG: chemotaxis protein CheB, partial [Verrucomicrobiota bacterium]